MGIRPSVDFPTSNVSGCLMSPKITRWYVVVPFWNRPVVQPHQWLSVCHGDDILYSDTPLGTDLNFDVESA